jgi:hypothetical protein
VPLIMTISMELPQLVDDQNTFTELDDLSLQFATGINDFKNVLTAMTAQSNEGSGVIDINFSVTRKTDLKFMIYDLEGRELKQTETINYSFGNHSMSIDLNLPEGIYLIRALSSLGNETIRVVKY